jgi:phosphate starvation-inducible PhoH-like protein
VTQIDLPDSHRSGLVDAVRILRNIDGISVQKLTDKDVIRHKLVQDIIKAYESASKK